MLWSEFSEKYKISSLQVQVKFQIKSKLGLKAVGPVSLFVAVYFQSANSDAKFY